MFAEKLKRMRPIDRMVYFMTERESIRLKRLRGEAKPWTENEVLQRYRFCNVRRMDDKVSSWLLENWYKPYYDHPNILLACTVARHFNHIDSLKEIGFPETWEPKRIEEIMEARAKRKDKVFSSAYLITGAHGARGRIRESKVNQVVYRVCDPVARSNLRFNRERMEVAWQQMLAFNGFSSFIAGQVVADLRWAAQGKWKDRLVWAPAGLGSIRGLLRVHSQPISLRMTQYEFLNGLREVMKYVKTKLPATITERLEAHDYQSCLCEFDKMERVLHHEGTPRQRYNGVSDFMPGSFDSEPEEVTTPDAPEPVPFFLQPGSLITEE